MSADDAHTPDRLERLLQTSLKAVDPGPDFTTRLQARLAMAHSRRQPLIHARGAVSARQRRWHAASLGLAASIVVALAVGWQVLDVQGEQRVTQAREEQARLHRQVRLALEITGERLQLAQQRIARYRSQEKDL